jgi:putative YhdH/YhfP family quinone oxidoreductase
MLLAQLGYTVTAVSGKPERADWLRRLGAATVVGRDEAIDASNRPLLKARWAGVVDTVGGPVLASLLRQVKHEGCIAACGVVGGADVRTSVYPFILRGVTLRGIDSAWYPIERRRELWELLAGDWRLEALGEVTETVGWEGLSAKVSQLLAGGNVGRTVLDVRA